MRILIVGAGATGIAVGVRLTHHGRDVTYLVRAGRREALQRYGAVLTAPEGRYTHDAATIVNSELTAQFDLIIVAVKAGAIATVVEEIAPAVGPETIILPFLNGMRHIDLLHARYPGHVAGGLIKIVASLDDQGGAVQMTSLAEVTIGSLDSKPLPSWVQSALAVPGLSVAESADVQQDLWEKWAFISAAGVVTCLFDNTVGHIREAGGLPHIESAISEAELVVTAAVHGPREAAHAQSVAILTEPGSAFTSSLFRDLSAGNTTEAEHILGDFARRARNLSVSTPLLDLALIRIRAAELSRVAAAD
ncbi:ketopantoate reductase family protein [Microbacterium sp. ZW T5_45]|uniref:ketopantoate reductase family protein n=1 Tax=Microbacterium sp. ZW T5_45 TaxID=3378080 RepID=UPI003853283D